MKKYFEQPALEVVPMNNKDIVTDSIVPLDNNEGNVLGSEDILAPGRRFNVFDSWYEGY